MQAKNAHSASFRDPSGYIFVENGTIKRVINPIYFKPYKALTESGFYNSLFKSDVLIRHKEISRSEKEIIIEAEKIPFISYPYEWSFNMYKEAALLTLRLQKYSLEHGFSLKDASAFNVTFYKGKAVFIDTLSFDFYIENSPWRAYKQFITHFFGPLLLAHYHGAQQLKLLSSFIDGIPVKQISSMLPTKTKLSPLLYSNIHLLAKLEDKHNEDYKGEAKVASLSKKGQLNIIRSLYDYIKKLELKEKSEWENYYDKTNYTDRAFDEKSTIINQWVGEINPETLIDVGGNDGTFVRKLQKRVELALVSDIDNNAVDYNYKTMKLNEETSMLPLVLDVLSPSPAVGLNNQERDSFLDRIKAFAPDVTFALAVIHHISLSGNVPFERSAEFFSGFSKYLVIEFPKRDDSWVKRLLNNKADFKDYFDFYNLKNFIEAYSTVFDVIEQIAIKDSERVLLLLKHKNLNT
ncbi:class I SAM-dependent methyltransferase [Winogradskyella luteola]|uniref:Class I SAM-dependent methyltransferase n=1 Tax=Winogradskyella luteola TaxID=2828330 RepID=A0A9X1FCQ5_9FLAO|nr:class I SAM-dependent methyltransferase [Winogradskyella luteola]MBV7270440.1 class I SAM-dependent methyltransferase [Winogradskyella luteola]